MHWLLRLLTFTLIVLGLIFYGVYAPSLHIAYGFIGTLFGALITALLLAYTVAVLFHLFREANGGWKEMSASQKEVFHDIVIRHSSDLISIFDPTGKYLYVSPSHKRYGYDPKKLKGTRPFGSIHPADRKAVLGLFLHCVRKKIPGTIRFQWKTANGEYRVLETQGDPVLDKSGRVKSVVIVSRDVTDREQMERELETALKQKTEFLSIVVHQLRGPITMFRAQLELLLDGDLGKPTGKMKNAFKEMGEVNANMRELVGTLLHLSRLERGRIEVNSAPVDLAETVRAIYSDLHILADTHRIHVDFSFCDESKVETDQTLWRLIAENLIQNAVKYSHESGAVSVTLQCVNDDMQLIVRDRGIGIPKGEQAHIFNQFYRASNANRLDVEGTGLGLYLSKTFAEMLSGSITFTSEEGKGSEFTLTIPRNQ